MAGPDIRLSRGLLPLLLSAGVVVAVTLGLARGVWLSNLHNGLLALAFTGVGAYVVFQRPANRMGSLFLATGVVEAIMFFGRQVGHSPDSAASAWWGWLGTWTVAVGLALTTLSVFCFPDGRLPSRRWRWVVGAVLTIAVCCAALSALWPVEYSSTGVRTAFPFALPGGATAGAIWSAAAHPAYIAFQLLWVVAIIARWRGSGPHVRLQLTWLVLAAVASVIALLAGLIVSGTPTAGVLAAIVVPTAAGWSIVHGQQVATYQALTWLSRTGRRHDDLPTELARAAAEAVAAPAAILWIGTDRDLHAVGVWPETGEDIAPTSLAELRAAADRQVLPVAGEDATIGAISVGRADRLATVEARLLDDLAAQAALVIEHLNLAEVVARQRRAGQLDDLTPREREVLELIAAGKSNAAICRELNLSIKTVEPVVSAIFVKLSLHPDSGTNRRVLAVLAYLRGIGQASAGPGAP